MAIATAVRSLPVFASATVVAFYYPLPSEPQISELIDAEQGRMGKQVVLPGFGNGGPPLGPSGVSWAGIWLAPGPLGLEQPTGPAVSTEDVELFLVPGLAFDRLGFRLGRGKGYYDRLLAQRAPTAFVCGLCFEDDLIARLPHAAHDVPMDCLITPREILNHRDSVEYPLD